MDQAERELFERWLDGRFNGLNKSVVAKIDSLAKDMQHGFATTNTKIEATNTKLDEHIVQDGDEKKAMEDKQEKIDKRLGRVEIAVIVIFVLLVIAAFLALLAASNPEAAGELLGGLLGKIF